MTTQSAVTIQIGRRTWSAQQTLHGLGPTPLTGGLPVAMIPTELCTQITWKHPWQISTYLAHRPNQVHATSSNLWTSGGTNVLTARHHSGTKKMEVLCTQIVTKISVNSTERLVQFITKTTSEVMVLLIHYIVVRRDLTPLLRSGWVASETMPRLLFSAALEEETWLGSLYSGWLHQNEDATLCIICDNYNRPQHSFLSTRADLGGGCRGCAPSPPSWDDLRFSDTTGILQKKNYVVYWCWSRARDECTPS